MYACKNCGENNHGWCKVKLTSIAPFKKADMQISECKHYIHENETPIKRIKTLYDAFENSVETAYDQGYIDGLKTSMDIIIGIDKKGKK